MKFILIFFCAVNIASVMAQNVGVGIAVPTAKLHVDGPIKLEGLNLFEFGAGIAGKEVNAGKIGYTAFGQNALTFIGAGTSITNRAVFFYAEGGTTFNGPVNVEGPIQLSGNTGTVGQVLTSNGAADPTWKNAAYSNTTRFAVRFNEVISGIGGGPVPLTTQYNLNTADVTVGANNMTINKTGLYHFDIYLHYIGTSTAVPNISIELLGLYPSASFILLRNETVPASSTANTYRGNWRFSLDVHIAAPLTFSFSRAYLGVTGNSDVLGNIVANLISQ